LKATEGGKEGMNEIKTQNDEEVNKEIIENTRKFFWLMTPCSFKCRIISTVKMMAALLFRTLGTHCQDCSVTT
jgi:hypothetical protein